MGGRSFEGETTRAGAFNTCGPAAAHVNSTTVSSSVAGGRTLIVWLQNSITGLISAAERGMQCSLPGTTTT